jgi:ribonuclease I
LRLESEITNLINTQIESNFNAKLESMKASLIKTEVDSSLIQELSLEMDKQINIVSEIDAQM